jgi:thioredoxin-dependent peroxiredoxin
MSSSPSPSTAQSPREGERVPEFSGTTDDGRIVTSAELTGHPAVVYFYPKARSLGCSIEAREFARHHAEFVSAGVRVLGVSVDSVADQGRFRSECALPFELLADVSGDVTRRFGVASRFGWARRTTFLVGPTGIVERVVRSWRPAEHVRAAVSWMAQRSQPPSGQR